jgi:hypothetical protein
LVKLRGKGVFLQVIGGARSSVSAEDLVPFDKWTEQYGQDGSGASGQRGEDDVQEFAATDAATAAAAALEGGDGGGGGGGVAGSSVSRSEGLGMLLAQLATHLPAAMRVTELEQRVASLEQQLALAQGGGGAVPAEGEPPADTMAAPDQPPPSIGGGDGSGS